MTGEAARSSRARPAVLAAKGVALAVSASLTVALGYSWLQVRTLAGAVVTEQVIEPQAHPPAPTDEQNILLVGLDTRTDAHGNPLPAEVLDQLHAGGAGDGGDTTDTIIVIHIPQGGKAATAISIPRDSYVQLAGGAGPHKINSAYSYGRQAALTRLHAQGTTGTQAELLADQAGAAATIATVEQFTGLTIDHFAAVNLAGFYAISQAVGGVPVCLLAPVHDSYSGANFPAGQQTISGVQALQFVRQRHGLPNGDLDRITRQQVFLAGLADTLLSGGTLLHPATLIDAVSNAVTIDSGWDILTFARQLAGLSAGDISFHTIPVVAISLRTPNDGDAVQVDPRQVRDFVRTLTTPQPSAPARAEVVGQNPAATPTVAPLPAITAIGTHCVN